MGPASRNRGWGAGRRKSRRKRDGRGVEEGGGGGGTLRSLSTTSEVTTSPGEFRPRPPARLERPYPSSQKGGTLIAERARDPEAHLEQASDPPGYRPGRRPRCGPPLFAAIGVRHAIVLRSPARRTFPAIPLDLRAWARVTRSSLLDIVSTMPTSVVAALGPIWRTLGALATWN
jgi:hypothetical protein